MKNNKIRNNTLLAILLLCILLSGCATGYIQKNAFRNGYSEKHTDAATLSVTFEANEMTPPDRVKQFALLRAAEISLKNGYRFFEIEKSIEPKRLGKPQEGLHYPSVRLYIKCYTERPSPTAYAADELIQIQR